MTGWPDYFVRRVVRMQFIHGRAFAMYLPRSD